MPMQYADDVGGIIGLFPKHTSANGSEPICGPVGEYLLKLALCDPAWNTRASGLDGDRGRLNVLYPKPSSRIPLISAPVLDEISNRQAALNVGPHVFEISAHALRPRSVRFGSSSGPRGQSGERGFPLSRPWLRSLRRRIAPNRACLRRSEWLARFGASPYPELPGLTRTT
jgi:hypothetical protein